MATYRIRVGAGTRCSPAPSSARIANEGGLSRGDFGHIDIKVDHTLVELPADLSDGCSDALRQTRISGQLIELRRDAAEGAGPRDRPAKAVQCTADARAGPGQEAAPESAQPRPVGVRGRRRQPPCHAPFTEKSGHPGLVATPPS